MISSAITSSSITVSSVVVSSVAVVVDVDCMRIAIVGIRDAADDGRWFRDTTAADWASKMQKNPQIAAMIEIDKFLFVRFIFVCTALINCCACNFIELAQLGRHRFFRFIAGGALVCHVALAYGGDACVARRIVRATGFDAR